MSLDAPTVAMLNDKNKFSEWAAAKGLRVPKSFAITSKDQLFDYNPRCDGGLGGQRCLAFRSATERAAKHKRRGAGCRVCWRVCCGGADQSAATCRLEASEGMRFLLKSVHYASLSRTDLFTLPCSREVLHTRLINLCDSTRHHRVAMH